MVWKENIDSTRNHLKKRVEEDMPDDIHGKWFVKLKKKKKGPHFLTVKFTSSFNASWTVGI